MRKTSWWSLTISCLLLLLVVISCSKSNTPANPDPSPGLPPPGGNYTNPVLPQTPYNYADINTSIPAEFADLIRRSPSGLGLPEPIDNTPLDNPITNDGATLGRVLFYDKHLSVNNTISCGSCHHADKGFTDGRALSVGFDGNLTKRNAMSIVNLRYFRAKKMFWDLRAGDLETQALMPIQDLIEMGIPDLAALETKLRTISYYPPLFQKAFGSTEINSSKIAKALSQFMRSIISFGSKYDKGVVDNFANFTPSELQGKILVTRAFCTECHSDLNSIAARKNPSFLIVDNNGTNTGLGSNNGLAEVYTDKGIGGITLRAQDEGTFKIPTLRNVELTAPYMHDGRFQTLEQVIDHYATGVKANRNLGVQLPKGGFRFSDQEKKDIIAFLKTLTDAELAKNPKYADPFK